MPRPTKRSALRTLAKPRLAALVEQFAIDISPRSAGAKLVDALARARKLSFAELLHELSRDELKQICRAHDLDDSGRSKDPIIARILAGAEPPSASVPAQIEPAPAPAPRPSAKAPPMPTPTPPPAAVAEAPREFKSFSEIAGFIWSVADLLRGDFKAHEYGQVILPFTVLRRLDLILAPTREAVWKADTQYADKPEAIRERMLLRASGNVGFYNRSLFDFDRLTAAGPYGDNFINYVNGFSKNVREILEQFRFTEQLERLDKNDLLLLVAQKFAGVNLHPDQVSNAAMGSIFEELIRKFAEQSNETAGEHFTPREVIRFMVELLFIEDEQQLGTPQLIRTLYDPACGTGGMLSVAEEHLLARNPEAQLRVYGQELNPESYAICRADMLIKGDDAEHIKLGNSFSDDGHKDLRVDYLLSNPPFGVDWSKAADVVKAEHETLGARGRFGPGLPRKNDGSLLFLLHMLSKMKTPEQGGSRLAIVFNGSPLFTGAAESGESEIRRYLLENDLLEVIVALPDQMFFNTGINTYIWVVTNRKPAARRGKVQLINGVKYFQKMRKSLGDKRKELSPQHIEQLTGLFKAFEDGPDVKIFANEDFGFHRITVERPLQLDFQASPERLARLEGERTWISLASSKKKDKAAARAEIASGKAVQAQILAALGGLDGQQLFLDRRSFVAAVKAQAKLHGLVIAPALMKAILSALSEHNDAAELCRDKKGEIEADSNLRDYENVPLTDDIDDYMAREVLPHVPDAWVDRSKTKVGYEIPFTRHFYEYVPPRALGVIEAEILALEDEIRGMLGEVLS
ncbi:Type I restriction-modification system, DNA-methyltransferase subunit M [Enhygromyxa salina]|uniref:site-specific DNA-methyltransferase (adenine-specific) n=1 Tax=Enhygromyxa salina TaxID=215803 RepID=A0A0C2CT05_9BACT|nr:class I SAM-dependent DNA methyltransferase [Enhygromyxa salina]KIG14291.1 Type I restriction-modification system, DNA-methyltransferase subunit M [Enhygromyxa salina]